VTQEKVEIMVDALIVHCVENPFEGIEVDLLLHNMPAQAERLHSGLDVETWLDRDKRHGILREVGVSYHLIPHVDDSIMKCEVRAQ
jgi:hypothetical protein